MTRIQRIGNFLIGLLMIVCGSYLLVDPKNGLFAVALVLGLAIMLYGLRKLIYYLTMARHMAGGLSLLFIAMIALDISVLALVIVEDPRLSIVLYLICYNAFTGILSIARGVESKLFGSSWVPSVIHGLVNLSLVALCIAFLGSDEIVIYIFCANLFYNAGVRIVSAFRPTEIIYIQ